MKSGIKTMTIVSGLLIIGFGALPSTAQTDWPTYGHDPGSTRYSPLNQIDRNTVAHLTRAWTYHMNASLSSGRPGGTRALASEATPIVANGVMYIPTPYSRVVAMQPETGQELWAYDIKDAKASTRGVEYWRGDNQSPASIFFGSSDGHLVALNAVTGKLIPGFGTEGFVDMKQGIDNGFSRGDFNLSSPPVVYKNIVITGARVQESPSLGFSGDTRGWDVHTGKLIWQFHSVPRPGETGSDTWRGDDWKNRSGTNVWGLISIDTQLGLVYLPYGSPTYDFYGGDRKGDNLFGNCLVALDAQTGKLKWYFQAVHHDTWDYDLESAPILLTVTRNNATVPAVAVTSKTGLVFILDRRDGKPLYGVEERPVPPSDVPGEQASATEPFPVKPGPLSRMSFDPANDFANITPKHSEFCAKLIGGSGGTVNNGPFTHYNTHTSVVFPGTMGASNWHGGSYDPTLGYLFYNTINLGDIDKVVKSPDNASTAYNRTGYLHFWNSTTYWPCQAPPWAEMVAIDANTGEYAWRVPLGVIEELDAIGVHNTGTMNMGGSVATAGGIVFIAATNDRRFRAFDSSTGKVLWETQLEAGGYASPMTYQGKDGKQYVVIVAAGGGNYDRLAGDGVVAFALPAK